MWYQVTFARLVLQRNFPDGPSGWRERFISIGARRIPERVSFGPASSRPVAEPSGEPKLDMASTDDQGAPLLTTPPKYDPTNPPFRL